MAVPARAPRFEMSVGPVLRGVLLGVGSIVGAVAALVLLGLVLTQTETAFSWSGYTQQIVSGLSQGAIFASLALALVLIYRTTDVLNFAQGEMATFTTFIAWSLMHHMSYWPAFALTLLIAFIFGAAIERTIIRPVEHRPEIVIVIVTIGLLIALNGLSGWIWNPEVKAFDSPFSNGTTDIAGVVISYQDLGVLGVCLATVVLLWAFFRFTTLGLVMRAVANSQDASRLLGVRVGWMLALGWGLAAVLGGIDSPLGAVVGGLILGVLINVLGTYVDFIGGELRLPAALAVLLIVLLIRPQGLFGHRVVRRV